MTEMLRYSRTPDASPTRAPGARLRPADHLYRAATAHVVAHIRKESADRVAREIFGAEDRVTGLLVTRAAVNPATMGTSTWAGALAVAAVSDAIVNLAPASAAAAVIERGLRVSLDGVASITVPFKLVTAADAGAFLGENSHLPVKQYSLSAGPTLVPTKFGCITSFTRELQQNSVQDVGNVVRQLLGESAALALDAAVFSSTAATAGLRPAGILNGVTPITATAGGGLAALAKDIENIFAALATAGGGVDVIFVASPAQAASLKVWAGPQFDYPVFASAALAAGTIIAIEAPSFVSAFGPEPEFRVSTEATLHYEDTTPLQIGTAGTPNTVAAPVRSLWQQDLIGLSMILRASWAVRASGHVQVINSVTW